MLLPSTSLTQSRMISWLSLHHNRARLYRWSTILGSFAVVQLIVQVLNAAAGFMLVRALEKPDYAWFTIASGMSATLSILSDAGIGTAVTSIGGMEWQDKASLKGLVQAAMRLRLKLALIASIIVAATSLSLLLHNGADLTSALGLTALVLAPIWQISTTGILNVVNRLHSRTRQLQLADLAPAVLRTGLTFSCVCLNIITPVTALLAVTISQLLQFFLVRKQVLPILGDDTPAKIEEHYAGIRRVVSQLLPNSIFTCVQAQITIWLISIFATNHEVAELGALNRIGIIFVVLGGPVGQYIAPAFARADGEKRLWALASALIIGCTAFNTALVLTAWLKGEYFLWLLGSNYAHLREELVLILIGGGIYTIGGFTWSLNSARGWTRMAWLAIPLTLSVQAVSAFLLPLNTIKGLAWFGINSAAIQSCHAIVICICRLKKMKPLPASN